MACEERGEIGRKSSPILCLGEKSKSVSFSRVYVCVKAKLTLVSFFYFFFIHLPLIGKQRGFLIGAKTGRWADRQ